MKIKLTKFLLSAVLMMCCTVMASAQNSNATKIGNIYYILDGTNKTATVTWGVQLYESTSEYTGNITIPSVVNDGNQDYSVTAIGDHAFNKCTGLTSITIPEGVASIGNSAFGYCSGLTSVSLPKSLKSIGSLAFNDCYKIFGLKVPDGVTSIGNNAFCYIRNVIFNGNATGLNNNWGACALNGYVEGDLVYDSPLKKKFCAVSCSFTSQLVIPEGVGEIGNRAIYDCSVSSVVFPSTVTKVGSMMIRDARNLKDIYFLPITPPADGGSWAIGGYLTLLEHIYVLNVDAYERWNDLGQNITDKVALCPLDVLKGLYKNILTDKKNTASLTDEEKSAVDDYITKIENTTEILGALKIYTEAIIYILMKDADYLTADDVTTINTQIAAIQSATEMGAVATAESAAINVINKRQEKQTAIAELKAYIADMKIANAPMKDYTDRINAATTSDKITDIVTAIKTEIDNYKIFTLGDWKYLLDDNNGECTIVGGSLTFTDKDLYKSDHNFSVTGGITYSRTFTNTNWQPLYVPFAISYDEWKGNFDVAAINNFHEYTNENGETVKTELEVRLVKDHTLKPNHPYLIRAKSADEYHTKEIILSTRKLCKSDENSIVCSSVERKYTFTGTYKEMTGLNTNKFIFMSGGKLCMAEDDNVALSPQRWYLSVESLGSQFGDIDYVGAKLRQFDIKLLDGDATGIDEITVTRTPLQNSGEAIYNLNGMRVNDNYKGIVVKNGNKFLVK